MRSIPEKTLEHWASIYLANRFPNGALWWPASGEDVLAELPRLAASAPGKTLALELKTTEARNDDHVLEIDTRQLARYLYPRSGPPLPVYYVFPTPRWKGSLASRSGFTPLAPGGTTAPPEWWRRQAGEAWFGDWLYVMPARSVAAALRPGWRKSPGKKASLFTLQPSHFDGGVPIWASLFTHAPPRRPMKWASFWKIVTACGPDHGVRWRTIAGPDELPKRVLVLDADQELEWSFGDLFNQTGRRDPSGDGEFAAAAAGEDVGGDERLLLHIPEASLA
ncbi:hypothetical protein ACIRSS_13080 [Amycolatopsis sp. NPDC101161]|uniref:hypothetical protein n=1 Tax=Amycolatopsis sp. NPDC101161 TaxID=3363940 RepID=UPI0038269067